jgi:tetratricopeptide (TPR) repeat protein
LRPPPVRRASPAPPPRPSMPQVTLPTLAVEPKKKELTLLGADVAAELARKPKRKLPVVAFALVGVLVAAGGVTYVERDLVIGLLTAGDQKPKEPTPEDKALELYAAGQEALGKNQLDEAARSFVASLALNPKAPKAHRALAITLAKQNKAGEAVQHYRTYLELDPKAQDADKVRKIIADYEKAHPEAKAEGARSEAGAASAPKAEETKAETPPAAEPAKPAKPAAKTRKKRP